MIEMADFLGITKGMVIRNTVFSGILILAVALLAQNPNMQRLGLFAILAFITPYIPNLAVYLICAIYPEAAKPQEKIEKKSKN